MKAVATHALCVEPLRNRIVVGDRAVAAVKGGVEAGDLGQPWKTGEKRTNRRKIVRLVKRRQRHIALELREHLVVDEHGPVVVRAAVHDPMSDRVGFELLRVAQPGSDRMERGWNIRHLIRGDRIWSIGVLLSAASARSRGRVPMPSICPLISRSSLLLPSARTPET